MTEPEASIRFALYYIKNHLTRNNVIVPIDGSHIKTKEIIHFPINTFLKQQGLSKIDGNTNRWQGVYQLDETLPCLEIVSKSGVGDIVLEMVDGMRIVAESKKEATGKGNPEYPLLREAIGQLMTNSVLRENDCPMVVVPYNEKVNALAEKWSQYTQMKKAGIRFGLVHDDGEVTVY